MESFALIAANLIGGVICLVMGLIIQSGKANSMIAGYNNLSEEDKAKWDPAALSRFVGRVILILPAGILLIACIPILLDVYPIIFLFASWILYLVIMVGGVIYLNAGNRFKRRNDNNDITD